MLRRTGLALAWLALSTATMVLSFSACYVDLTEDKKGTCEDDLNPCTDDTCVGGTQTHTSVNAGEICFLGDNEGTCNGGMESGAPVADRCILNCEKNPKDCSCTTAAQCPKDEECAKWSCDSGFCARSPDPMKEGATIGEAGEDDCKKEVCQGGTRVTVADIDDPPPSDECVLKACDMAGATVETPAALGTDCNSGTNECNGKGTCVTCFSIGELGSCGPGCKVKLCNGETSFDGANCQSGNASDGVCCDTACTGVCKSCNQSGDKSGVCTDIPYYQPDPSYVPSGGGSPEICSPTAGGGLCNGQGQCLQAAGFPCLTNEQCLSSMCKDMKCLGAKDEVCTMNSTCISGMCMLGKCT